MLCVPLQHTETQDSNLILGGPAEDPDLADILRGPAAAALNDAEGAEAPDGAAAPDTILNPASHPKGNEQAAKPARAAGRRGRAPAHASAPDESADSAPAQQAAVKPRGAGRRKGKAPMATIAEETAVKEQPESVQPRENAKSEGAWGGRRRRKGAAVSESFTEGLDNSSAQLQQQSQHAGTDLQAAAAADQHAKQPAAEHDRPLAQDATQKAPALPKVQQSLSIGPFYWNGAVFVHQLWHAWAHRGNNSCSHCAGGYCGWPGCSKARNAG